MTCRSVGGLACAGTEDLIETGPWLAQVGPLACRAPAQGLGWAVLWMQHGPLASTPWECLAQVCACSSVSTPTAVTPRQHHTLLVDAADMNQPRPAQCGSECACEAASLNSQSFSSAIVLHWLCTPEYCAFVANSGAASEPFRVLTTCSWEQSDMMVKIYVPLRGVQTDMLRAVFTPTSLEVRGPPRALTTSGLLPHKHHTELR